MNNYEEILVKLLAKLSEPNLELGKEPVVKDDLIPVGISNRHIHLSQQDLDKLFGSGYQLTKLKDLSQPGQYACQECVTLCGPKGVISKVRVLGPVRPETQVEILASDTFTLGIKGEVRLSGDLVGTKGATIVGPKGSVELNRGVILAKRHIHMLPAEAERFGVVDGQSVAIEFTGERGGTLNQVIIRVTDNSGLECHIDTEEANALGVKPGTKVGIKKN